MELMNHQATNVDYFPAAEGTLWAVKGYGHTDSFVDWEDSSYEFLLSAVYFYKEFLPCSRCNGTGVDPSGLLDIITGDPEPCRDCSTDWDEDEVGF